MISIGKKPAANRIVTNLKILMTIRSIREKVNDSTIANLTLTTNKLSINALGLLELF